jgi:hypothetical protein
MNIKAYSDFIKDLSLQTITFSLYDALSMLIFGSVYHITFPVYDEICLKLQKAMHYSKGRKYPISIPLFNTINATFTLNGVRNLDIIRKGEKYEGLMKLVIEAGIPYIVSAEDLDFYKNTELVFDCEHITKPYGAYFEPSLEIKNKGQDLICDDFSFLRYGYVTCQGWKNEVFPCRDQDIKHVKQTLTNMHCVSLKTVAPELVLFSFHIDHFFNMEPRFDLMTNLKGLVDLDKPKLTYNDKYYNDYPQLFNPNQYIKPNLAFLSYCAATLHNCKIIPFMFTCKNGMVDDEIERIEKVFKPLLSVTHNPVLLCLSPASNIYVNTVFRNKSHYNELKVLNYNLGCEGVFSTNKEMLTLDNAMSVKCADDFSTITCNEKFYVWLKPNGCKVQYLSILLKKLQPSFDIVSCEIRKWSGNSEKNKEIISIIYDGVVVPPRPWRTEWDSYLLQGNTGLLVLKYKQSYSEIAYGMVGTRYLLDYLKTIQGKNDFINMGLQVLREKVLDAREETKLQWTRNAYHCPENLDFEVHPMLEFIEEWRKYNPIVEFNNSITAFINNDQEEHEEEIIEISEPVELGAPSKKRQRT